MSKIQFFSLLNHKLEPEPVEVEVHSIFQIPSFSIIGLPAQEVFEARERIRSAVDSSGFEFPKRRITLNLSPANVPKSGVGLDLAMALSVLESEVTPLKNQKPFKILAWGELGLSGSVRSAGNVFRLISLAQKIGVDAVVLSKTDHSAALSARSWLTRLRPLEKARDFRIFGVDDFKEAKEWIDLIRNDRTPIETSHEGVEEKIDLKQITSDQPRLGLPAHHMRMLEVALSGEHHCLLVGPKGSGKSQLLEWFSDFSGNIEPSALLSQIYFRELRGESFSTPSFKKPVRKVQSQIRPAALIGRVKRGAVNPGEFSLAHGGLLIADEFMEWPRDSIDQLRVPIETGEVILSQAEGQATLPARFQMIAAGNFCRCGKWMGDQAPCRCALTEREQYFKRISGPVFDRIDLIFKVLPENNRSFKKIDTLRLRESIDSAQRVLRKQWGDLSSRVSPVQIENYLSEHPQIESYLNWVKADSLRARHKVFRVAITLAALEEKTHPERAHFTEAAIYRPDFSFSNI